MRFLRLAACAAAFAVVGGMAVAEDMDIRALQAKLAAQEARLNDLQAKMGSGGAAATPANITSIRKNAKVTIGGNIATRYHYASGEIERDENVLSAAVAPAALFSADANRKEGSFYIDGVGLEVAVNVSENVDAFIKLNLHDQGDDFNNVSNLAEVAWVRWKNIANTGWGVLVGRDSLKFMSGPPIGLRSQWNRDQGSDNIGIPGWATGTDNVNIPSYEGFFTDGSWVPSHLGGTQGRTTQINAFWTNACKTLTLDFSVFQSLERKDGMATNVGPRPERTERTINYGLGTGAFRAVWTPVEDWKFTFGAINLHANGDDWAAYRNRSGNVDWGKPGTNGASAANAFAKDNSAFNLGFEWNPTFLCNNNLTIWGNVVQEFNAGWTDGLDNTSTSFGVVYAFTDKLKAYVEGSYMYAKNSKAGQNWYKADGWRGAIGAQYNFGSGFVFDVEYLHTNFDYENRAGQKHTEVTGDKFVANLGFSF